MRTVYIVVQQCYQRCWYVVLPATNLLYKKVRFWSATNEHVGQHVVHLYNMLANMFVYWSMTVISHCLPIFDELCHRSPNFARSCITHDCPLIRFIASHGIVHARIIVHPSGNIFCTVLNVLIVPVIVFFSVQSKAV